MAGCRTAPVPITTTTRVTRHSGTRLATHTTAADSTRTVGITVAATAVEVGTADDVAGTAVEAGTTAEDITAVAVDGTAADGQAEVTADAGN